MKALGAAYVTLEELMERSDIVSLHVPVTDGTRGLIGRELLAKMKKSAILINTARGPVVDNAALAEALENGSIAGAGIDVFDMEPPIPGDYPLLTAPHTILTPHWPLPRTRPWKSGRISPFPISSTGSPGIRSM